MSPTVQMLTGACRQDQHRPLLSLLRHLSKRKNRSWRLPQTTAARIAGISVSEAKECFKVLESAGCGQFGDAEFRWTADSLRTSKAVVSAIKGLALGQPPASMTTH